MQRYQNAAQDALGNVIQGMSVSVFLHGTQTLTTIFSDNGITTTPNPLTTDALGMFAFYAANGHYDIQLSKTGLPTSQLQDILLFDSAAPGAIPFLDGSFTLQNTADPTKQVRFSLAGLASGVTRIFTLPNLSAVLADLTTLASSIGSSLVGFIPPGPGAVTHNVGSVLGRTINIFDKMSDVLIADIQGPAVLDHTSAVQAAVDQAKANGQRLVAPYGTYNLTALNLNDITRGLEILGESDPYNAPVGGGTYFRYTGAGAGSPFTILSSFGINFRNCRIGYNNASFTGDLISTGWSAANLDVQDLGFEHVRFSGEGSGINANSLLKLDKTVVCKIGDRCLFSLSNNGIVLGSNYVNVLKVGDIVVFVLLNNKAILGGIGTYQTIKCDAVTLEQSASGKSCGIDLSAGLVESFAFEDGWCGDVSVNGGGPWLRAVASGFRVMGGFIGTAGAGATDYPIQPDNCDGVWIGGGVRFDNRALNIPVACRTIVLNGAHIPLGPTAIQNASGSIIYAFANPGIPDTHGGTVGISGVASPAINFSPSSGSTKNLNIAQNGNSIFEGETGVANHWEKLVGATGSAFKMLTGALVYKRTVITYSASMTIDASTGTEFDITVTDGVAFTINAPTNPLDGQRITVTIRNASGGAAGAATWNAVFKMSAWTNPANANSRSIDFKYNGTNWVQVGQTGVDVPN